MTSKRLARFWGRRVAKSPMMLMSSPSFRFTILDASGSVSFLAPAYALKMIAAACGKGADRVEALLQGLGEFDPSLAAELQAGLERFDAGEADRGQPLDLSTPFRIVDEATRASAQEPGSAGSIVVNLPEKRIVQIQNNYGELYRSDRGRMRRNGRPVQLLYRYDLPEEWRIVP